MSESKHTQPDDGLVDCECAHTEMGVCPDCGCTLSLMSLVMVGLCA